MKFEEMPVEVQKLFSEPHYGEVLYRPPAVPYPQPFIKFTNIFATGPYSHLEFICPTESWVSKPPRRLGGGEGFDKHSGRVVLRRPPEFTQEQIQEFKEPDFAPYRPDLELYLTASRLFAIASPRAFQVLQSVDAVFNGMWRDVLVQRLGEVEIETTEFKILDFPRLPIIDHDKTSSNWRKSAYKIDGTANYTVRPHVVPGRFATHHVPGAPGIVRDSRSTEIFVRPKTLIRLRENEVLGPDYSVLEERSS